jgi:hypothetical protein
MNETTSAAYSANHPQAEGRSIASLMRHFIQELTALLRDEVALAKGEMAGNISSLRGGIVAIVGGAVVLIAGLVVLLDAAVVALMLVLPTELPWLAPLIVGGIVTLIGAAMMSRGSKKFSPGGLAPDQTLEHNRRDRRVLQENLT